MALRVLTLVWGSWDKWGPERGRAPGTAGSAPAEPLTCRRKQQVATIQFAVAMSALKGAKTTSTKGAFPGWEGGGFICSVYVKQRSCRERMRVGTLPSRLGQGQSLGQIPRCAWGKCMAPIKGPADLSTQSRAGSRIPPGKCALLRRLQARSKGELGAASESSRCFAGRGVTLPTGWGGSWVPALPVTS